MKFLILTPEQHEALKGHYNEGKDYFDGQPCDENGNQFHDEDWNLIDEKHTHFRAMASQIENAAFTDIRKQLESLPTFEVTDQVRKRR